MMPLSEPEARMLVSCFAFATLTTKSPVREFWPTIMPS